MSPGYSVHNDAKRDQDRERKIRTKPRIIAGRSCRTSGIESPASSLDQDNECNRSKCHQREHSEPFPFSLDRLGAVDAGSILS